MHGKRDVFLEDDGNGDDKEREADAFASSQLIPEFQWRRFVATAHFSESSVQTFADMLWHPCWYRCRSLAAREDDSILAT
jgi:hypothetical protein